MTLYSNVRVGDVAPAFTLPDDTGTLITLASLRGQRVVLYFYPKDDTTGCTKEAQEFSSLSGDFAKAGVSVIGVSKDSVASHAKFTTKYDLAVPLGSDPEGAVIERYGAWVEKNMYGRKYMGIERSTFLIGKDGRLTRIWRKVKVPGHAAEVLKAAQSL